MTNIVNQLRNYNCRRSTQDKAADRIEELEAEVEELQEVLDDEVSANKVERDIWIAQTTMRIFGVEQKA